MDRRGIEGVVAVGHAQEAGGLLEGFSPGGAFFNSSRALEGAMAVAVADNVGGEAGVEAGNPGKGAESTRY